MYACNKNYLSIFSKEDINKFLFNIFPEYTDLVSEKK